MTTVAVIGLGIMGGPIAANLVRAGFTVIGYNRGRAKVDALVSQGGQGAASIAEAGRPGRRGADRAARLARCGAGRRWCGRGVRARPAGHPVDRLQHHRPRVAARLAEDATRRGLRAVDAPVSGGQAGADPAGEPDPLPPGETDNPVQ